MADFNDYKILKSSEPENERDYECLIISHSQMSKTYYFVRDSVELVAGGYTFQPTSFDSSGAINSNDLDQTASFSIGDIYNEIDSELDNVPINTTEKVTCRSLVFISKDLSAPVKDVTFFTDNIPQKQGSFTINSSVTDLNRQLTGEAMTLTRLPALRAI
ncbi:hypothetical protein N9878_00950 [bacterium]|nr:hypothetical protein [bacterium]